MRTSQSYLTPDEVIAVLKAAKERCARDWTMVLLDYRHGMRASEVCNVRLDDIEAPGDHRAPVEGLTRHCAAALPASWRATARRAGGSSRISP
jgi:integrase